MKILRKLFMPIILWYCLWRIKHDQSLNSIQKYVASAITIRLLLEDL